MWDLPGPGLEPVSPALAGGFLTTAPPRKSHKYRFDGRIQMLKSALKMVKVNIQVETMIEIKIIL